MVLLVLWGFFGFNYMYMYHRAFVCTHGSIFFQLELSMIQGDGFCPLSVCLLVLFYFFNFFSSLIAYIIQTPLYVSTPSFFYWSGPDIEHFNIHSLFSVQCQPILHCPLSMSLSYCFGLH